MSTPDIVQLATLAVTFVLVLVNIGLVVATSKLAKTAEHEFTLARSSCIRAVEWRYDKDPTRKQLQWDVWPIRFDVADMIGIPTLVESLIVKHYWNDREDKATKVDIPGVPTSVVKGAPIRVFVEARHLLADAVVEGPETTDEEMRANRRSRPPIHQLIIEGECTYVNSVNSLKRRVTFGATCRLIDESTRRFHIDKHPQIEEDL